MVSWLEELDRREAAAREEIAELRDQIEELTRRLAEREDVLSRLQITRETMTEILSGNETVSVAGADAGEAEMEEHRLPAGSPVGVRLVPQWAPGLAVGVLPGSYRDIVEVLQDAVHPMRALHREGHLEGRLRRCLGQDDTRLGRKSQAEGDLHAIDRPAVPLGHLGQGVQGKHRGLSDGLLHLAGALGERRRTTRSAVDLARAPSVGLDGLDPYRRSVGLGLRPWRLRLFRHRRLPPCLVRTRRSRGLREQRRAAGGARGRIRRTTQSSRSSPGPAMIADHRTPRAPERHPPLQTYDPPIQEAAHEHGRAEDRDPVVGSGQAGTDTSTARTSTLQASTRSTRTAPACWSTRPPRTPPNTWS